MKASMKQGKARSVKSVLGDYSRKPHLLPSLLLDATLRPFRLRWKRGVECEGRVHIRGWPLIDLVEGTSLTLEDGVMLNSRNEGYHVNMHSPVKIMADRPGARIRIGAETRVHGTCIHAYESITIGKGCLIAANTQIFDGSGHDLSFDNVEERTSTQGDAKPVEIQDYVWIGANVIVLPGVCIGRGSVIAAGSVVVSDIPPLSVAGGNPARVIRSY